jgi:hypothetical protein
MSGRRTALRNVVVAIFFALASSLIPLATAFAEGGGTVYPH